MFTFDICIRHTGGGGPMTKPVGGPGWQGANKPGSFLEERLPELRRPPSLSLSPLRARRRSVVSVLTGGWGSNKALANQHSSTKYVEKGLRVVYKAHRTGCFFYLYPPKKF